MSAFAPGGGFVRWVSAVVAAFGCGLAAASDPLPRFTEEREAAALNFVRRQCPELTPLMDELRRSNRAAYELQVRETFQVTEYLADLQDDAKRYDLELRVWKAENKAMVLVARLATPKSQDRKGIEDRLLTLSKELVDLDLQGVEHRVSVLEREATTARDELARARDLSDRTAREKYEGFLAKAKKKRGS